MLHRLPPNRPFSRSSPTPPLTSPRPPPPPLAHISSTSTSTPPSLFRSYLFCRYHRFYPYVALIFCDAGSRLILHIPLIYFHLGTPSSTPVSILVLIPSFSSFPHLTQLFQPLHAHYSPFPLWSHFSNTTTAYSPLHLARVFSNRFTARFPRTSIIILKPRSRSFSSISPILFYRHYHSFTHLLTTFFTPGLAAFSSSHSTFLTPAFLQYPRTCSYSFHICHCSFFHISFIGFLRRLALVPPHLNQQFDRGCHSTAPRFLMYSSRRLPLVPSHPNHIFLYRLSLVPPHLAHLFRPRFSLITAYLAQMFLNCLPLIPPHRAHLLEPRLPLVRPPSPHSHQNIIFLLLARCPQLAFIFQLRLPLVSPHRTHLY